MKSPGNTVNRRDHAAAGELARQSPEAALAIEHEAARHEEEARRLRGHQPRRMEHHGDWPTLSRLPMRLTAAIPLPKFRVSDLAVLERGQLIKSDWASTDDVPLKLGAIEFSWSEFEVVEERMAARITRLG